MTEQPAGPAPDERPLGPDRIITLTDGVVAIAMTLLALDLKPDLPSDVSSGKLADWFLRDPGPGQYVAFVLAFVLIAQYWLTHHRMLRTVTRHDDALTWANMLFLFGITLLPLTTYIIGNFDAPLATSIFAATLVLLSVSLALMTEVIDRRGLRTASRDPAERRRSRFREVTTIVIPLVVAVLTWFVPHVSYLFFLFLLADAPGRLAERRHGRRHRTPA